MPGLLGVLLLDAKDGLILHVLSPFAREVEVGRLDVGEKPLLVVFVPKEELEVFGGPFNINKVIHEVTDCTRLKIGISDIISNAELR